ncbi:hypothetical protein [Dasania marina]|uniref:capsular polysaccharide export protein, LipB/KpsS family n=1 Tax=Dasania marina TaxID=471499 RepID=UPI0030DBFB14|tara:strand:+ start:57068 stop:58492 length:1425 start_codon:yes stop_codon:yes gene_type:complete
MLLFGLYSTPEINQFLVNVSKRIQLNCKVGSVFIAWGEDAKNELESFDVNPVWLPEPNPFQKHISLPDMNYTSRSTELKYDIEWIIDVERQFNIPFHDPDMLAQRAVFAIDFYELLIASIKPKLIVLWNGEQLYNRVLRSVAGHLNIEVVFIERGPLPETLFLDETGVNAGASFINKHISSSSPGSCRHWSKRVSKYLLDNNSAWSQPKTYEENKLFKKINYTPERRIVFLPLQVDADTNMIMYSPLFSSTKELFDRVAPIYAQYPEVIFLVKNHPKSKIKVTNKDTSKFYNCILIDDISVKQILPICHHVITNNSNVGFESLLFGVPVIQAGSSFYQGSGLTIIVKSLCEIDRIISKLMAGDLPENNLQIEAQNFMAGLWDKGLLEDIKEESAVDRVASSLSAKLNEACTIAIPEASLSRIMVNQTYMYADILKLYVELQSLKEEAKIIPRLYGHPVIGRVWRFWRKYINKNI